MRINLFILLIFFLCSKLSYSEESEDNKLFLQLQEDMNTYAEIATSTKQNVDYMPYVISTLNSEKLSKLGILNLRDALSLVPGIDLNVGMAGVKNPIFRGSNPYAFGQSKLIIDGVEVNDKIFGGYNQYLDMPTDIIHRIEIVRGPGSLLSHVNGYAGSIHVITKANRDDNEAVKNEGFLAFGSNDYYKGGGVFSNNGEKYKLAGDIYYKRHDLELPVGKDRFGNSGDTDQSLENYQLGLNYEYNNLQFKGRFAKNESGVSYGQAFSLTDDSSDYLDVDNNYLELIYQHKAAKDIQLEFSLGYFDEHRELQNKVVPDGVMMLPNGRYFLVDYKEQTFTQRLQANLNNFSNHKITAGILLSQSHITKNDAAISNNNLYTSMDFDLFSKESRHHTSYYIDDLIDVSDKVSFQIGAKFDQYNNVSDQFSPRLALVYRQDDYNIYKAMYSHSYREPSWREQYLNANAFFLANPDLKSEEVDAYEFSYIRKLDQQSHFKINVFYLENKDQIHAQNNDRTFENSDDNELYGAEFEYENSLWENGQLYFNYSYVDGSNVSGELANTTQNMVRLYYIHSIAHNLNLSGVVKYVGEKGRIEEDSRDDVDDYFLVDLTAQYESKQYGTSLSLSVKNIFDEKYDLPSPNGTYPGDFEQDGRSVFLQIRKGF